MNTIKQNPYLIGGIFVAGLIIGAGLMLLFPVGKNADDKMADADTTMEEGDAMKEGDSTMEDKDAQVSGSSSAIEVVDQPAGRATLVARAALPALGWVVVHEVQADGTLGNALGASRREAGVHQGVVVDLLRGTEPGKTYAVLVYEDNGNKTFELHDDAVVPASRADFKAEIPVSPTGE